MTESVTEGRKEKRAWLEKRNENKKKKKKLSCRLREQTQHQAEKMKKICSSASEIICI